MYFIINVLGVLVFLAIGVLLSKKRKEIQWRSVGALLLLNVFMAWFLTSFSIGREIIVAAAAGFSWLISVAYDIKCRLGSSCFFTLPLCTFLFFSKYSYANKLH